MHIQRMWHKGGYSMNPAASELQAGAARCSAPGFCLPSAAGRRLNLYPFSHPPFAPLQRDSASNKGEGLGFMFSCFSCFTCCSTAEDEKFAETAATAERHYSLPPSESAASLPAKAAAAQQ